LHSEKGGEYLIKAFKLIHAEQEKSPLRLVIVGDGPQEKELRRLVYKLALRNLVDFKGSVEHGRMSSLYSTAFLVVMPSMYREHFGRVGLEAMSHAVPVVAFNVGGIHEFLNHGISGFLVERGNVEELAKRILELDGDRELARKMGQQGRTDLERRWNSESYYENIMKVYSKIAPAT